MTPTNTALRLPRDRYTSAYTELAKTIRELGLLRRRYWYYWSRVVTAVVGFVLVWVAVVALGNSWFQLICAAALGVVIAQFGFLGHDAAHRQIFASAAWNDWSSRIVSGLILGMSYGWWKSKHNRHHNAPNQTGKDPDIAPGVIAFTPEDVERRPAWLVAIARFQGWLLIPLLTLEGLSLQVSSARTLANRRPLAHRWTEVALIATRMALYLTALLLILPPGKAFAFLGVQLAVMGVALGGAFVPNHVGMPIVPKDAKIDFLRRQVLMSRNIAGGWLVRYGMGGLQCQIEHHLFPSMPRPALTEVQPLIKAYCQERDIQYTEVRFGSAYRSVISHLNTVGLRGRNTFTCPLAADLR